MQIVLPLIALLTVLGAWSGWRRSPLYSVKITLQLAGAFLLIVAAIVGASMAILHGPARNSPGAQAILGFVALLLLTTGAMILIVRITDAHVAKLPPSVHLVTIHRRRIQRWIWRLVVYVLISAAAAIALPSSGNWLPMFLGGFVLLLCGPMLAILYMMARRNDRGLSAIIAGPWAHWQYSPAQWESWAKSQLSWERSRVGTLREEWRGILVFIGICGALFAFGALLAGGSTLEKLALTAICLAVLLLFLGGVYVAGRGAPERHYRRILAAPREVYFGDEGVFCNGDYSPWTLSGKYLLEAAASSDPPAHLVLTFQSFNGSTSVREDKRIPIPDSGEPDLALLQQKLRACCRTASVRLVPGSR